MKYLHVSWWWDIKSRDDRSPFPAQNIISSWLFGFCALNRYTSPKMSMVGRRRVKGNTRTNTITWWHHVNVTMTQLDFRLDNNTWVRSEFISQVKRMVFSIWSQRKRFFLSTVSWCYLEVSKKAKIRNRYNQVPHLTQDTTWESDKSTRKHHR